jgi:hypothetical protein
VVSTWDQLLSEPQDETQEHQDSENTGPNHPPADATEPANPEEGLPDYDGDGERPYQLCRTVSMVSVILGFPGQTAMKKIGPFKPALLPQSDLHVKHTCVFSAVLVFSLLNFLSV